MSGLSLAPPQTTNAWGSPLLAAPTQQSTTFSTLSASQTTILTDLVTTVNALKNTVDLQATTIANYHNLKTTVQYSEQTADYISDQILDQTGTLQSEFEEHIKDLKVDNKLQSEHIAGIVSKVDAQDKSIASINSRLHDFDTNINKISTQVAPLSEAVQAGGLAALMQQTILGCLSTSD